MINNQNKTISKMVKIEECKCGKQFDFARYIITYSCQGCLNSQKQTTLEKSQNQNHENHDKHE